MKEYNSFSEAKQNIENYFEFYNKERFNQGLGYKTPSEIYFKHENKIHEKSFDKNNPPGYKLVTETTLT